MKNEHHIGKIEEYIFKSIQKDELDCNGLVQLTERINRYLNLKTLPNYAKNNGISYNGAKNHRQIIELFGCKFIADKIKIKKLC